LDTEYFDLSNVDWIFFQVLVPNASFLGHLSGILTGIISLQFLSAFQVAQMSFNFDASAPGTTLMSGLLLGLQFDLIPKVNQLSFLKLTVWLPVPTV
jgi:hypothetical protein